MLYPSFTKKGQHKNAREIQPVAERKNLRERLAQRLRMNRLALELANEWNGITEGFQQHLYVE